MARGANAEAEAGTEQVDGEEKAEKTTVKAKDLDPNERVSLMFGMPAGLKAKIEEAAETAETSTASLVRKLVAEHFGYALPTIERGGARKKYANDEEKEAARKSKGKQRRDLIKKLLEAYAKNPELAAALQAQANGDASGEDDSDEE